MLKNKPNKFEDNMRSQLKSIWFCLVFFGLMFCFWILSYINIFYLRHSKSVRRDNTRESFNVFILQTPFLQSWTTWKISLKKLFDCLYNTQEEGSWSSLYFQIFCVPLFLYESKRETKIVILLWYQRWTRATLLLRLC